MNQPFFDSCWRSIKSVQGKCMSRSCFDVVFQGNTANNTLKDLLWNDDALKRLRK